MENTNEEESFELQLKCKKCRNILSDPPSMDENFFGICPSCNALMLFDNKEKNFLDKYELKSNLKLNFFFSHSFKENDKKINDIFRNILFAFYIPFYQVESDIEPKDKIAKAREGIKNCDYFFVIMTKRYLCCDKNGGKIWKSSEWIQNEIGMAYSFDRPIISMVEIGVKDEGVLKDMTWCNNFNRTTIKIPYIKANNKRSSTDTIDELIEILKLIDQWSKMDTMIDKKRINMQSDRNIILEHQL